jgi:CheY-like chemotaxis protein
MVLSRVFLPRAASLSGRLPDALVPGLWVLGVVAASVLAWLLTVRFWVSLVAGVAVMVVAAWRLVKSLARLRDAADEAERGRAAMEQVLRRSQKMEALGRLTVGVAHDFNNHLTVISSNVEMVARRLDPGEVRLLRHTDAAMQGVRRAAILTGRLLAFSRPSAAEPEAVDADRLVNGSVELLRRTLGDRIRFEVRVSGSPWFVWVDVNQMENALLSLVVNARDQVPDGGVLSVAVSNVQLDAVFAAANPTVSVGDYIQISVNGSPDTARLARWGSADDLSSADLFMARAFVREAGGCLLHSDPADGGVSLRLFLPRHTPPAMAGPAGSCGTAGRKTILVVEDEPAIRCVCVETLREAGYHVLEAPDAMEAFRLIADHGCIDLLFTDLGLPGGVSGRALADAARHVDPAMRVLFTTGYERADLPDRAAAALLQKPFNPAQLAAKVQAVLAAERTVIRSETVQS